MFTANRKCSDRLLALPACVDAIWMGLRIPIFTRCCRGSSALSRLMSVPQAAYTK